MNSEAKSISDDLVSEESKETYEASKASTMMNLLNSLLGAGILGISNTFALSGIAIASLIMIIVVILTDLCCKILINLTAATGTKSFDDLAVKILGKAAGKVLSVLIILFCISCLVAYLVILGDIVQTTLAPFGIHINGASQRALLVLIVSVVVPIPLTLPSNVTSLTAVSTLTVVFIIFFGIIMIIEASQMISSDGVSPTITWAAFDANIFSTFTVHTLTFALPTVLLPVLEPFSKDEKKRESLVSETFIICFFLVYIPGIAGYLIFGAGSNEMILNSFDSGDVLINIVRLLFFFIIAFSYPIVAHCALVSLFQLIFEKAMADFDGTPKRLIFATVLNAISVVIACFLPNIRPALSIGGAMGGCLVDYAFPALMWFINSKDRWFSITNIFCLILVGIGIVVAIFATAKAIKDALI